CDPSTPIYYEKIERVTFILDGQQHPFDTFNQFVGSSGWRQHPIWEWSFHDHYQGSCYTDKTSHASGGPSVEISLGSPVPVEGNGWVYIAQSDSVSETQVGYSMQFPVDVDVATDCDPGL